jgi:hypothetical protein
MAPAPPIERAPIASPPVTSLPGYVQLDPDPVPVAAGADQLDPDPARAAAGPVREARPVTRPKALAPGRFALQLTIGQETRDKLERAQALLRRRNRSGDLVEVIDRALEVLVAKLEKEKFGATSRPRARKARQGAADPHHVPNEVKREVHARDQEQCAFVSDDGTRCTERACLEFDHRSPVALGGASTTEEVRLLCEAHNQYEAERQLGAAFMRRKRQEAATRRAAAKAAKAAAREATQPEQRAQPEQLAQAAQPAQPAQPTLPGVDGGVHDVPVHAAPSDPAAPSVVQRCDVEAQPGATPYEERLRQRLHESTRDGRCSEASGFANGDRGRCRATRTSAHLRPKIVRSGRNRRQVPTTTGA